MEEPKEKIDRAITLARAGATEAEEWQRLATDYCERAEIAEAELEHQRGERKRLEKENETLRAQLEASRRAHAIVKGDLDRQAELLKVTKANAEKVLGEASETRAKVTRLQDEVRDLRKELQDERAAKSGPSKHLVTAKALEHLVESGAMTASEAFERITKAIGGGK